MSKVFGSRTLTAVFLVLCGTAWGEEPLTREDFESYEVGAFPRNWNALGAESNVIVRNVNDVLGNETQAVRIRSQAGKTQGISRQVDVQEIYRVEAEVFVAADMERAFDNIPIDVGFAVSFENVPLWDSQLASAYAGGDQALPEWFAYSSNPGAGDRSAGHRGASARLELRRLRVLRARRVSTVMGGSGRGDRRPPWPRRDRGGDSPAGRREQGPEDPLRRRHHAGNLSPDPPGGHLSTRARSADHSKREF